jgi:twitching motility protein PilT
MTESINSICGELLKNPHISDLHATVNEQIWQRVDGDIIRTDSAVISSTDIHILVNLLAPAIENIEAELKRSETVRGSEDQRDGIDFSAKLQNTRLRVNLSKANTGQLSLVMRKLNDKIPTFEELGLPQVIMQQARRPSGLVIVTGPTGSGKSTTLAAMCEEINVTEAKHILTIEDPVEYELVSKKCKITRKEIGHDTPSYPAALRASLRQDPDVIMVGEIRDCETMRIAFSAAESGHLVFATMHTNSAVKTVDRVTSFFPGDEKEWAANVFATTLNCIVSQTLVRKIGDHGRVLAYELLINGADVKNLISEQKTSQIAGAIEQGKDKGHVSMNRMLTGLIRDKIISIPRAFAATYNPVGLKQTLEQAGIRPSPDDMGIL